MTAPAALAGKRERNRAEKLARIRAAARTLFVGKGYDATTLREVAEAAGVGFGTLFDYATDKRDLLFLVCTPDLREALAEGCAAAEQEARLIEQVMRLFESYYALYAPAPRLWRDVLRELNFYSDGLQAQLFLDHRTAFLQRLEALVAGASDAPAGGEAALAAQLLLSTFAWEVRRWLSATPLDVAEGLRRLRALLDLQLRGVHPAGG